MEKLRVFEAFAGVGSQRMALRNLNIDHEVVGICEIDKYALKSYQAIHGDCKNFGDISKVETNKLPNIDLFTYSFPCQDLSVAGNLAGLEKGTRSGLLYECEKIIENKKPKYLLLENVKNLVGKRFKKEFDKWLEYLEELGYTNYWKILNSKDYGIPQNRERVFLVSILDDTQGFKFKEKIELNKSVKDLLEENPNEKYYLKKEIQDRFIEFPKERLNKTYEVLGTTCKNPYNEQGEIIYDKSTRSWVYSNETKTMSTISATEYKQPKQIMIPQATKKGYIEMELGGICDLTYPNSKTRRGRVQENGNVCPTLTATRQDIFNIDYDFRIRKITPLECWRLMGFDDADFYKCKDIGISDNQLYKQAGNSIVVNVLESIFENLFKEYINEK